jgi:hypothetical protein
MAQKIADFFYRISPTESITFTIAGQADPHVFLDNLTLQVTEGEPFTVTPQMLAGMGAVHFLTAILVFPDGKGTYNFTVSAQNGPVDEFPFKGPNQGDFSKVTITIQVA